MLYARLKTQLSFLYDLLGWKTNRRLVVFESDDWGSIRIPSKSVYNILLKNGIKVDQCPYCKYDALETNDDLNPLFNLLIDFKDLEHNHPVITTNMVMANPDFEKIRKYELKEFYYEVFTDSYKRYDTYTSTFNSLKAGIEAGLFHPQFHGREHLNITRWMNALQNKSVETLYAFNLNTYAISTTVSNERRKSYLEAFGIDRMSDLESQKDVIKDGLNIFKSVFGFNPESFIAPNYTWHPELDSGLLDLGVRYFQSSGFRIIPHPKRHRTKIHYLGSKNRIGQTFLRRNCHFEPSLGGNNPVDICLNEISSAFKSNNPAIIQTHRLNFIGSMDERNRERNLSSLRLLLKEILRRWPDVEFISSDNLGKLMTRK
jgi:hypothetical protein